MTMTGAENSYFHFDRNCKKATTVASLLHLIDWSDFCDVTLACEDGALVEAHKVILAGSSPETSIHTH